MYKPPENNQLAELKSHSDRSHNLDSQLNAIVRMLARGASELDNNSEHTNANHHKIEGEKL